MTTAKSQAFPGRRRSMNAARSIAAGDAHMTTLMDEKSKQYGTFIHETRPVAAQVAEQSAEVPAIEPVAEKLEVATKQRTRKRKTRSQ